MHQLLVWAACAGGASSTRASEHRMAAFVWHTKCHRVTEAFRSEKTSRSSAPGSKLMCLYMCVSRVHQCAHACAGCAPVCKAHAHVGCKHTCACRGHGHVDVLCVHTHVQAGLACRGCKVCCGCVHPTRHSGALPPHEVWGCKGGCSPLPSLTCPGHRLHRDPSFTKCQERNFCFFIPPEHPLLGPFEG